MHEDTELAGVQGTAGISRRDMLRKSAVVGGAGALMWAAPSITKFGGAAFGETDGTGRELSYAAICYTCPVDPADPEGAWDTFAVKFNFAEGNKCDEDSTFVDASGPYCVEECETGSFRTPDCPDFSCTDPGDDPYACIDGEGGRFTIEYLNGLSKIRICFRDPADGCEITGVAYGKCASSDAVEDPCVAGAVEGHCITFDQCGLISAN